MNNLSFKSILGIALLFILPVTVSAQSFLDKVLKGVEKTNQILDETDKILGNGSSSSKGRRSSVKITSPHPDIEIQYKSCIMAGSTVLLDLVITNYGKDAKIQLGGSSDTNAYDDSGNQYNETRVSIADGEMKDWDSVVFPTEVPLKFKMQILGVSSEASQFKRINLKIYSKSLSNIEPIILQNVPITNRNE